MEKYKTTGLVTLYQGQIGLAKNQAAVRKRKLKKVKGDIYEIIAPVQFKAGEVIRLVPPDKITLVNLDLFKEPMPALTAHAIKNQGHIDDFELVEGAAYDA
ncbi:MAG: hypothetical protein QM498_01855 [Desulfobacterium sp.]